MGGKESTDEETDSQDELRLFTKRIPRRISFRTTADEVTDEEAEKFPPTFSKASRKATKDGPIETITLDSSEDAFVTPKRRRLSSRIIERLPKIISDGSDEQAADDLREDLEDLREIGKYTLLLSQTFCNWNIPMERTRDPENSYERQDEHAKENYEAKTSRNA